MGVFFRDTNMTDCMHVKHVVHGKTVLLQFHVLLWGSTVDLCAGA